MSKQSSLLGRDVAQLLSGYLFFASVLLVLCGVVPASMLALVLAAFVLARGAFVAREAMQKPRTASDWDRLYDDLIREYGAIEHEQREQEGWSLGIGDQSSPSELARAAVTAAQSRYVPPRTRIELGCESLGLVTFAILLPAVSLLYTRDFVSVGGFEGWVGLGVVAACIGLYAWPLTWPRSVRLARWRMSWWALPFLPALALFCYGVAVLHPYLDPFREDRVRLAADKVLALQSNVEASRRSGWVFAYARQLEREGRIDQAISYYRAGLRLDPMDGDARARLAVLEGGEVAAVADPRTDPRNPLTPYEIARIPVWTEEDSAPALERRAVSRDLAQLRETTAVLIPVGEVPDWLIDALGLIIQRELGIPAVAASQMVELPPHSRVRGLLFGRQWDQYSLVQAFYHQLLSGEPYGTPAKWILVTGVDIYSNEANFLFSRTHPWGAVVSYARLGDPDDRFQLIQRMGKNTLGAFVKSFGVPMSTDRNCVTSYTRDLAEFDSKGNRPTAQSLHLLRKELLARNRGWASHQGPSTKE